MSKELMSATVTVSKIGNVEDYKNLPVTKDDVPIGMVINCIDGGNAYVLTMTIWQEMGLMLNGFSGKPTAISFENTGR